MAKILIVYYSRKGENYCDGSIRKLEKGNRTCGRIYPESCRSDIFEIDTVKPYSENYMTCTEKAKTELPSDAHPEIKAYPENFDSYDNIFIGYPNWWGTMPMCIFTLLDKFDIILYNKT